jgi:outer membrane protein assembly factor BamB
VSFVVAAYDRADGRQHWEHVLPSEGPLIEVHEKHNLATASPVTDGERVYAWFGTGQIVALDLSGKLLWKRHLGAEYSPFSIDWGHGSSPIVFKDTVILLCYHGRASYLIGLDAKTGDVRWKVDHAERPLSYSTPFIVEADRPELIVNSSIGLAGHDPATGERLWVIEEPNRFPIPMPLQHDGIIYTSRGYRSGPFMAIRPGGKGDVSKTHVLWKTATGAPYASSLVYHDGLLYMAGDVGVLTAVDAKTGARVWQERTGGVFSASPVAGDGKIYMVSEDGQTIVLAAGQPPRVLARNTLNARLMASPAISEGRLFLRSDDYLYAVGK